MFQITKRRNQSPRKYQDSVEKGRFEKESPDLEIKKELKLKPQ